MGKDAQSRLSFATRIFDAPRMRLLFAALTGSLSVCACSMQSPTEEAPSNMLGLTEKQIASCLGTPAKKSNEGATEVWSYPAGQACFVQISFIYGRASHVAYVGPGGAPLSPGEQCPVVGEHCALR